MPRARKIDVIDREKKSVIASWGVGIEISNFPIALDEPSKRLFVVCRTPARLIVFDTDSGKSVAKLCARSQPPVRRRASQGCAAGGDPRLRRRALMIFQR